MHAALLAQTAASAIPAGLSAEFLGLLVFGLVFLSKWLWDYKRSNREDAAQFEPRAAPALHRQFVTRDEFNQLAERVNEIGRQVRDGFAELDRKRSVSVAGLHDDLKAVADDIRAEIKSDNGDLHERITELVTSHAQLSGAVSALLPIKKSTSI